MLFFLRLLCGHKSHLQVLSTPYACLTCEMCHSNFYTTTQRSQRNKRNLKFLFLTYTNMSLPSFQGQGIGIDSWKYQIPGALKPHVLWLCSTCIELHPDKYSLPKMSGLLLRPKNNIHFLTFIHCIMIFASVELQPLHQIIN